MTIYGVCPRAIADSLPDMFGNTIFRAWMDAHHRDFENITVIEQLSYFSNRGMGALEYYPSKVLHKMGRKAFLFAGSHQATEMTAAIYLFMATCKKNGADEQD